MKNVTNLLKFLEAIIKLTVITNISSIFYVSLFVIHQKDLNYD